MSPHEELKAAQLIFEMSCRFREEYSNKMIDMIKVVISLSAAMLSIMAVFSDLPLQDTKSLLLVKLSLLFLLLAILFGIAALHSHAEIHQIQIEKAGRLMKESSSLVEVVNKMQFSSVEPRFLYRHVDKFSLSCFFLSLVLITWVAIENI